ncbi:uncharacterized protein EDB91DRAFT_1125097 [Suillus paluster]|uniref:uncharacterized protein n=1 Tax=Suillus paluster TaxID=48578 RepID=UPI001B86DD7D|nr:uncharacterized protein EDB91DRAFT_1125097 [Suillus paluster]KAG1743610.1 hypothetical protein EDB91DRAFT_1125097 [Suillus paluster]
MTRPQDSFTFTVGKLGKSLNDAVQILLGERAHLIEFPSILLPPGATTGSIVNIAVHQNIAEERKRDGEFWSLQDDILDKFGSHSPDNPQLELRNVTQTSVTLEWPPIKLATAKLRSLDIYKNGQRLAAIPNALSNYSTKLSGLSVDTPYSFQLMLRTSAGVFPSNLIRVRTHTIADTSGISVCFANVTDSVLLENAKLALKEMRAKWSDKIQIDTTHFVCTTPAVTPTGAQPAGGVAAAPGAEYQRALQLSIPVVQPQWILACHSEKKMVPISGYYLASLPSSAATHKNLASRQSLPAIRHSTPPAATPQRPIHEEEGEEDQPPPPQPSLSDMRHKSSGTMDRNFKFPNSSTQGQAQELPPPVPSIPTQLPAPKAGPEARSNHANEDDTTPVVVVAPSSVEVPPPPPVEKEIRKSFVESEGEEEVGETVEIDLR